jgi:pimeloyl-ACP methyl ester carboxylesterase
VGGRVAEVCPLETLNSVQAVAMLLIHGAEDEVVPIENSQQLWLVQTHSATLHEVANVGHNTVFSKASSHSYQEVLMAFLQRYVRQDELAPKHSAPHPWEVPPLAFP